VVAVGATYDGNLGEEPDAANGTYQEWFGGYWPDCFDPATSLETITCFTNSSEMLDLLAPGARITAAGLDGERWTFVGTSQAAPTVAGVAALMLEADEQLTPATIETLLRESGRLVTDPRSGRRRPAVDALAALRPLLPVAPSALTLSGPPLASTGVPVTLTAAVTPLTATQPLLYRWQATGHGTILASGGLSDSVAFVWSEPGMVTVTATASNDGGQVSATWSLFVEEVALADLRLSGPATAATGAPYQLKAEVSPLSASRPITYYWETAGQPPRVQSTGPNDEATFTWDSTGNYTVTLAAGNRVNVLTRTHNVTVEAVPPLAVALGGPAHGATGFTYTFVAAVSPTPVSQPLVYTWSATDQLTRTLPGPPELALTYAWETPGVKLLQVEVTNVAGRAKGFFPVEIVPARHTFLPVFCK
jgi:hypothetical protein